MRDAMGGSMLFYVVIIIIGIIVLMFIGALSYAKAYRVKNRIIEIIEKHGEYPGDLDEINIELDRMGYALSGAFSKCNNSKNLNTTNYQYCVYLKCSEYKKEGGVVTTECIGNRIYEVVTYVHFDFPFINDFINIPVKGQTKTLGKNYDY